MQAPFLLSLLFALAGTRAEAASFSGYYEIVNRNSGMVLEVPGWATTNGADLDQWHGDAGANQQWTFSSLSNGCYEIINRNSGLPMEVAGQSTVGGAPVDQWAWWGGSNQEWSVSSLGNGCYEIINRNSGLPLEVAGQSLANGGNIDQWAWWGGNNQQWLILSVGATATLSPASGGSGAAAKTFHGFNWADPSDNYIEGPLLLSGLGITDTHAGVETVAGVVLGAFAAVGANTVRIPINPETAIGSWWASYKGVIDQATSQGLNVIVANWEGSSSGDGQVDDPTTFWQMWDTVVTNYNGNPSVYFEIFNEPFGYSAAGWLNLVSSWLARYPTVAHGRVLVGGTGYDNDVPAVASSSLTSGCLFSVHDYGFYNGGETNDSDWYGSLAGEVGAYASSSVLTEFGASMTYGWNYAGGDQANNGIASIIGFGNYTSSNDAGSVYWPGLRDGDSYSMFTRNASTTALTLNSPSGLDLVKYGWSGFNGAGTYQIVNGNSGLALEAGGWATTNGAHTDQWLFDGGANQLWGLSSVGGGYCEITNVHSGLALEVAGESTADGALVDQRAWGGGANQQWAVTSLGNGFYKIINRNSGLALEVAGWSATNGATVDQWTYDGGANQVWTFGPPALLTVPAIPAGLQARSGYGLVSLSWAADAWATNYLVKRSTSSGAETNLAGTTNPFYTDSALINGATYYYEVAAQNATGQSGVSSEVQATPRAPVPGSYAAAVAADHPLAYWPLAETNGTVAFDPVGGYNGTYVGGVALAQPGIPLAGFVPPSQAARFDGASGYVDIPEGPFNLTNALTLVAWLNVPITNHFSGVMGRGDSSWRLSVNNAGDPGASDGGASDATGPAPIEGSGWHMLAYVYTGVSGVANNGSLYVDGALAANDTVSTPAGSADDVWIGGAPDYGDARLLPGAIAQAAVFTRAFSAAQVRALYAAAANTPPFALNLSPAAGGRNLTLSWAWGALLQAPTVTGPWTINPAASPCTVAPTNAQMYYRIQAN